MSNKTTIEGVSVGDLMQSTVRGVHERARAMGFRGVVDLEINVTNVVVTQRGLLVSIFGSGGSNTTTSSVKLATRIRFDDGSAVEGDGG